MWSIYLYIYIYAYIYACVCVYSYVLVCVGGCGGGGGGNGGFRRAALGSLGSVVSRRPSGYNQTVPQSWRRGWIHLWSPGSYLLNNLLDIKVSYYTSGSLCRIRHFLAVASVDFECCVGLLVILQDAGGVV